ncbi:hypothetical protein C8R45DRAFT_1205691 [Mycena sanguinolenta]|nr:hypothetical protein C8R45DRAFT_1216648 [Mycena sanguinolenta]KAJ6486855.1 hypothetical protein C8R45DRAFT_1214157 [Mycena sanguinolenta]KAJ6515431.1 hypothetical protein C8R45DRAFT_1205691 [Mycena sanguinolenta]
MGASSTVLSVSRAVTFPRLLPGRLGVIRLVLTGAVQISLIRYVYNASNNELVRTNTLVKSTIIQVDAMLFRQWYETHYAQPITKKGKAQTPGAATSTAAPTEPATIDLLLETQFAAGCLYASISKWLGQSGRADGHILEGKELEGKLRTGKQKHAGLIHLSV